MNDNTVKSPEVESVGARIKRLRHEMGWTQRELANFTGVSFRAVEKWESGQRAPYLGNGVALARCLGVTAEYLQLGYSRSFRREMGITPD